MKNIFIKSKNLPKDTIHQFRQARSMNTAAFHIETGEHDILCGSKSAMYGDSDKPITLTKIEETWDNQHAGWFWCKKCVEVFKTQV